ncbi:sigma-70 family RNA polymerase sigma factor [Pseudomonas putida]|uniref:sigma-70 family RNA polymerase sigma factor n=1 Tax=Pseudomonas putida TaxID=303 RepID=UPI0018AA9A1B|nr:sigma-70 family RNA polymerase sigma factor [Pseudomonas putida]MBF8658978.1 sigma-70 family RNA polymerase sigma factor [Pseudomonas putida]
MFEAAPPPTQSFPDLYREHRGWLEGWLRRRMGNAWDAADLSQDTFLRVMASAQPLIDIREPRAYLLTVGKRLLSNLHQRRSLEKAYLEALMHLPEQHAPSPEQRWLLLETLQALDQLLDGLKPVVRKAFLLSQLEGLSYAEIASRLGVCERSVKRYMAQAYEHCLLAELQ